MAMRSLIASMPRCCFCVCIWKALASLADDAASVDEVDALEAEPEALLSDVAALVALIAACPALLLALLALVAARPA